MILTVKFNLLTLSTEFSTCIRLKKLAFQGIPPSFQHQVERDKLNYVDCGKLFQILQPVDIARCFNKNMAKLSKKYKI